MENEPPLVECIFCGATLPPDQAADFLRQIENSDQADDDGPQPICVECQEGIDENERERQALAGPPPTGKTPYALKVFFAIAVLAFFGVIIETVLKRYFLNRR